MKFQLLTPDHDYSSAMISGGVNGGTAWLYNIADALRILGQEAEIKSVTQRLEADYVIVQSVSMISALFLDNFVGRGGKVLCLLEHFNYPHKDYLRYNMVRAMSKHFLTAWEGEVLEGIEATFFPHAYNDLIDDGKTERKGSIVFAGNSYNLRSEDYFDGLNVTRIYATLPKDMPAIYRGADVCLSLHGNFQKNIISKEKNRLSDKPGMMINERFWGILGAGGLMVTDWVPQMARWFDKDELIIGESKEQYQDLVNYYKDHKAEGLKKLEKAIQRVRNEHTYKQRVSEMLKLC